MVKMKMKIKVKMYDVHLLFYKIFNLMFLGHHNGILKILNLKSMLSRCKTWKVCCKRESIKKVCYQDIKPEKCVVKENL